MGPANRDEDDEGNKYMKTITKLLKNSMNRLPLRLGFSLSALALVVVALTMGTRTANAAPGDLFESDFNSGTVYKFAPDGTRSTFATGLNSPAALACDTGATYSRWTTVAVRSTNLLLMARRTLSLPG